LYPPATTSVFLEHKTSVPVSSGEFPFSKSIINMKNLYTFCLIFLSICSHAQFSGAYAPSNWTTTLSSGSTGSVNTSGAPGSITLNGSDGAGGTNVDVDYTITATASGALNFNWSYHTNDSDTDPSFDLAGVLINGVFTQLSNNAGSVTQSGSYTVSVSAGNVIGFRIRATDNVMGDATLTISAFSPPTGVLPVKLVSFTAQQSNDQVQLQWTTASEIDFSHFVVERSGDGINFKAIHTITSGASTRQYNYTDENPLTTTAYYRLRLVDNNSSYVYSKTVSVKADSNLPVTVNISPNPASNYLLIRVHATTLFRETISIVTPAGVVLKEESLQLAQGLNSKQLNIASFSKGVYFIRLKTTGTVMQIVKN
jgi:hypothetical protein